MLDASLFSFLNKVYFKKLLNFIIKDHGFISLSKKIFYSFFERTLKILFIKTNIEFI